MSEFFFLAIYVIGMSIATFCVYRFVPKDKLDGQHYLMVSTWPVFFIPWLCAVYGSYKRELEINRQKIRADVMKEFGLK